jgi:ABC-type lipoprotein export system ATPase subunit
MSSGPETVIALRGVERSYRSGAAETFVLRAIDLDVRRGEFLTVMGPSGSGKSTLLNVLGMLDADWRGTYHLLGQAVHEMSARKRRALARRHIGFVFQEFHLLEDLTVYENLEVPLSYRDVPRREREALVADTLDGFGIVAKKDLLPSQLSGGQRQLVAVARAVIAEPTVVLADEPTGSLHSSQGDMIMDLLMELHRTGATIVQVTHNEAHAARGDRIVQLRDGWLTA